MSVYAVTDSELTSVASAIRTKGGTQADLEWPDEYVSAINALYPEPTGSINITQNGSHNVKDKATAVVDVPNSYAAGDEGKVVSSGALVAQTSTTKTANGTYTTTTNNEVVVAIPVASGEEF